ncbi:OFA family MFS transporter [Nodosilinea sp. LEGE 07298]|uniref:L-lactate MFS transporter n=1 Tax=Nodosilinea sp. LEGE 07298 TaxID=2777970 RepID=UPI0018830C9C|nr:OFA family MFS transporter [Nodosilinea sp. LEGE 07298]MBE9108287.1 OFA family MFS transporter [Nodosilinea sp. LEGE 07298]
MAATSHSSPLTLFGLPAERGRWLLIPLGIVVLLCLGTVYAWSIFRKPLELELGIGATESLLPYTVALVFYAGLMPVAGFYIPRWGPRLVMTLGGLVLGAGYVLASIAPHIGAITLAYGVIAGTGVGIAYGVPMAVVARWFPERKGLAVGSTIIGFGLSPLITAPLANSLIEAFGARLTLRIFGLVFTAIILAIATTLRFPPQGWHPSSANSLQAQAMVNRSYPTHLLTSRAFYGLWICYAIGALVGLSAIGISSPVGEEIIRLDPTVAASSVALFAIFNGLSRPLFGWLSDRYRPHYVAIASYSLIVVACILMLHAQTGQVVTYLVAFCLFWFCLGGWLAMAPTLTLRMFNPDQYAQNYGLVFTAYGVGALVGTLSAGQIRDWLGSYTYAFYPMMGLAVVGIGVAMAFLKPDTYPHR